MNHRPKIWNRLDDYVFQESEVAECVRANLPFLLKMRHDQILGHYWKKPSTRVRYSGRGLLVVGIVSRLSGFLQRSEAVLYAEPFVSWFDEIANGYDPEWRQRYCCIPKQVPTKNPRFNQPRLVRKGDLARDVAEAGSLAPHMGRIIHFGTEDDYRKNPIHNDVTLDLPIGRLVKTWTEKAEALLRDDEKITR